MENDFEKMLTVDVTRHLHQKQGQTYLPWVIAWKEIKKAYPDTNYRVIESEGGVPYFSTPLGIIVKTEVTANGETIPMHLPVMSTTMKAMKEVAYEYMTKQGKKTVEPATMTDINKTIMRCLTKNIAMFGIGLFVFAGENMPDAELVGSAELQAIMDLVKKKNIRIVDVCTDWQMEKISQLHLSNFDNMINYLESKNA